MREYHSMETVSGDRASVRFPALKSPGKGLIAAYFTLALFAIFYIPYFFPVRPSTSESYIFGYNNTVGVVLLLLLASIGAIWTKGLNFNFSATGMSPKIPRKYLWMSLAVESAACAGMYLSTGRYGAFSEAEYDLSRTWLLSQGKHPFIDFEWSYGSGLLYLPKWLSDVTHLSIPQSYFLFWALASLAGIVLLYATINLIDFTSGHKTFIFICFSICALTGVVNMGVHYTWLRFLCPTYFILMIDKVGAVEGTTRAKVNAGVLALVFTAVLLLISPEVAIAHAFACLVVLYPRRQALRRREKLLVHLGMTVSLLVLFVCAMKLRILDSIVSKGQGTDSFPIIVAPATLFYFCAVFICACYVVQRAFRADIRDNTIALIAFSVPMTVAALGRCDPGHILLNGVGFFIAVFFYASTSGRMWKLYCAGFVACFLTVGPLRGIQMQSHIFAFGSLPVFPQNAAPASLYPEGPRSNAAGFLEAPFGYRPEASGFYFSPQIDYGYYENLVDVSTPPAYQRKISELQEHPQRSILLPPGAFRSCEVHDRNLRIFIGLLFDFPYTAKAVHRESVRKPLCDYVISHYTLQVPASAENFQYELWKPKP